MAQFERYYTIDEAQAEVPRLTEELLRLQAALKDLQEATEAVEPAAANASGNGGSHHASALFTAQAAAAGLVGAIVGRGILIKDAQSGLVDFPHIRGGEEVLLCWQLGEPAIRYWHSVESGFSGRQPLP